MLIVDDDSRNIFALTALLERGKLGVVAAESGADALEILEHRTDIDIVLMDIMMPASTATRRCGDPQGPEHADLPIIAVTGKAAGGRARALPGGRRVGLHPEARRHGGAPRRSEGVVAQHVGRPASR